MREVRLGNRKTRRKLATACSWAVLSRELVDVSGVAKAKVLPEREALALRRRATRSRFDVSPRAWSMAGSSIPVARLKESAFSGHMGMECECQEFEGDQGGHDETAAGAGIGSGPRGNTFSSARRRKAK